MSRFRVPCSRFHIPKPLMRSLHQLCVSDHNPNPTTVMRRHAASSRICSEQSEVQMCMSILLHTLKRMSVNICTSIYIYIYIYICTCMCIYVYRCIVCMHTYRCMCICTHIRMYVRTYIHAYAYAYAYACLYIYMYILGIYAHIYIYVLLCLDTYTHINTYRHRGMQT